jgi:histidine triad (HIT) family protein
MLMTDCIFCKIIRKEIPAAIVYEDKDYIAFLDINPVNKGHALVIPKEHYPDIVALPDTFNHGFMNVIKKVGMAVKKGVECEGFNMIINTGEPAGQVIFHVHCHVVPRVKGDGFEHWQGSPYENSEEMEHYKDKISGFVR